ncbi:hypothetical protein OJAV_G00233010 [Oryzias javanicus]|uniref:AIG1-type G domain-containing protein n=1 Tax=Oryzias javanicus TaxID=123683 RepID=A0A437C066_ORYJA|nr:hypothetical protein OJAV_G00233010 [Oryzias javanicus]
MGENFGRRHSLGSNTTLITNGNQEQGGCFSGKCCDCLETTTGGCFPGKCCVCLEITTVKYKMLVCGETFGAHLQFLDQMQTLGLRLKKGKYEESCITIVFCPVASRIGTDAEAAMREVQGNDPVILVFMHLSQEPKHVSSTEVLTSDRRVVLEVNILYHNKQNGLLRCEQNEKAANELKQELMKHHMYRQTSCCAIL